MNSTEVLNPRCVYNTYCMRSDALILESARAIETHSNYVNGKYIYERPLVKRQRLKETRCLTSSRIPGSV